MIQSFIDTMINGQRYMLIVQGLGITILIAICAILIGTVLGFILALMKVSGNKVLKVIAELYTTILRGIPLATQLMIFYPSLANAFCFSASLSPIATLS